MTMRVSAESQKKIDDRRNMLRRGVLEKGGKWDEAWIVDGVPRTTGVNSGRLDMYYISPDGKRMRSMSEVYSFLGLTPAPPKANAPAPSAAHVAAAAATAANSGRAVREAKLSASAAITASATNPYPTTTNNNSGPMSGQKRARGPQLPTQPQRGLKDVREADARMAAVEPQRWRARLFPIDARARAAVDAYDQSLRESTLVDWRCSHNTTVKEYAGRVKPVVVGAQRQCEEAALRTEQQCGAVAELFPVLRGLVNAFSATGMHAEHVTRAAAVLTACEAHHRTFTKDQMTETATLALTLEMLKDELAGTSTDGDEKTEASRKQLPSVATAAAINSARVAAHGAAAAAGNATTRTAVSGRMTMNSATAASVAASAAAAAAAAVYRGLPPRHNNRPTPPLGSFAAATGASVPVQRASAPAAHASTSAAQVPSPVQAANGAKKMAIAQPTIRINNNAAATPVKVQPKAATAPAATAPAAAAPSSTPARSPTTGAETTGVRTRQLSAAAAQAATSQPTTRQSPTAAVTVTATAAPSAASTQTRSTPTKPSSASPTAPAAPQSGAAAPSGGSPTAAIPSPARMSSPSQGTYPKVGSTEFAAAPIVSVRAPNGMLKGRLGNPSVQAYADGTLTTRAGNSLPSADAVHYIFTLDGIAGKWAGKNVQAAPAGTSREAGPAASGENCRTTQKHPAATPHTESQPEKRTGQCH